MSGKEKLNYSLALSELERIVADIESEETDVDALAERVKRASFLISFCRERLRTTGDEVKKILDILEKTGEGSQEEDDEDI